MRVEMTFSSNFDDWYNSFNQTENGKKLLDCEGISRRCLDVGHMSHSYFTEKFVDITIDANANSGESKNPNAYGAEIVKGIQKLEGMYLLHRYAERRFGLDHANKIMSSIVKGDLYFHDSSSVGIQLPYCSSISTTEIMNEGRPYGQLHSQPPKYAASFIGQVIELIMNASQMFAGAVAVGDLFVNYCYYSKKENRSDVDILNDFQRLVFIVNNPFRISSQSPFTNLSIFDVPNLQKLFGMYMYPDGSKPDFDYIMHVQKMFCEWFAKGDPSSGFPYRFPVVTMNICVDENKNVIDNDFLEFVSDVNCKSACFNIYVNSGNKISSCCFDRNTVVITKNRKGIQKGPIGNLGEKGKEFYNVYHEGKFVPAKFIEIKDPIGFVKINLSNGHSFITTLDHVNVTLRGNINSNNLTTDDYIPFSITPLMGYGGTYEMGYFVGAFIGDGSYLAYKDSGVIFSLCDDEKNHKICDTLKDFAEKYYAAHCSTHIKEKLLNLVVNNRPLVALIKDIVIGRSAIEKSISSRALEYSTEFRRGILDGLYATDGGNSGRIYTSSKKLRDDISMIANSIGLVTNIKIEDDREGRLGKNTSYCVRLYNPNMRTKYTDIYKVENNRMWFRVVSVDPIKNNGHAYCFEIDNTIENEPLFTLANGVITHNCRLLNNLDSMPKIDTFGNGSIGSIGSVRVVTLNIPRIAIKADGDEEKFFDELQKQLENARDLLIVHREDILQRRIDSGFLHFFNPLKWLNIKRYFSTFGIIGVYEANYFMGLDIQSEKGTEFTTKMLKYIENFAKETSKTLGYPTNVEEIPGESTAIKFVKKDRIIFGEENVPFELYSNQYLPLIVDAPIPSRIKISGRFQDILSGGGILHLNIKEQITDPNVMKHLIKYSVENGVSHMAINYGFGQCEDGHVTISGSSKICPICSKPIITWMTRIVGYNTLITSWSSVRREYEFPRRVFSEAKVE